MSQNLTVGKKGLYLSLAFSLGSAAVILYITFEEQTLQSVMRLNPSYLGLAALIVVALWLVEGLRIMSITKALGYQGAIRLFSAMRVYLVTYFFAGITPLAIGEWPAQIYSLCASGLSAGESAAVSLVRMFLTKLLFVVMAAFLLFIDGRAARGSGLVFALFRYAFWIMTLSTAVYLFLLWQSGLAHKLLEKLLRYARFRTLYEKRPRIRRFISGLLAEAVQFQETVHQINRKNILHFLAPLVYTVFFWSLFYSIAPVLLLGLGVMPDIRAVVTWQIMILLIIPYVPVPGGSGVAEFGLATLFAPFVPSHILGVFIVAWRFFTYYLTLLIGGIVTFGVKR
ncbi:MAG: flippase-like domain-containing protein [Dethiobacter sp.]|jgi:uncharacterized protein (TIRG00374 family)|nr:flippase-like domain-containing protein [Dethiobacter sp.]